MEQAEFKEKIISKLLLAVPGFHRLNRDNGAHNVEILSNKRNLTIWVETEDLEITIGLSGEKSSGWHMHLNRLPECVLDEEIDKAIRFIQSVLSDERAIFYSNIYGYTLNSTDHVLNHKKAGEEIESRYWSEM